VYDIEVRRRGALTLVRLRGEFDLFALGKLRETFEAVASLPGRILVDLAELTFLDLLSARELAARSQLEGFRLAFQSPSPEAAASIEAAGLEAWFRFHPDPDRNDPQIFSGVF
jgi:anti-anti-sigma factor